MKAAYIETTGGPEVIRYGEIAEPSCQSNQIKIEVRAVSVNPIDTYIRNGANYWPLPNPFVIGCDFAGVVVEVGSDIRDIPIGQRVWGSNQGLLGRQGTFAERISVDSKFVYASPDSVTDPTLAAVALVGITAHIGLFSRADIQPGETLFVRGGTGGVASMVIQMAKAIGARVITTAGSEAKKRRCIELGADHVILYQSENVLEKIKQFASEGVDVYWETLREPDFDEATACLASGGRMVIMAGRDARPPFPVGPFYVKGCSLHGFAMFKETAERQRAAAADINRWLATGQLHAQIDRVLRLEQAAEAHRLQESNTIQKHSVLSGKIVLIP